MQPGLENFQEWVIHRVSGQHRRLALKLLLLFIRLQLARIQHSVPEARPVLCALCWIICCGVMSQIGLGEGAVRG